MPNSDFSGAQKPKLRLRLRKSGEAKGNRGDEATSAKVRTLGEFARIYGLGSPDEVVGTKSTTSFLDYGPPIILADSGRPSRKAKADEERWQRILKQA
ncbi:MAG TPA: hypothetical protein VK790_14410 [Solirubrobacteraceae bacterium]|jgi:hypothetical protein|nr:hypothetical protein [Solirubrobacteraceae bacterium]